MTRSLYLLTLDWLPVSFWARTRQTTIHRFIPNYRQFLEYCIWNVGGSTQKKNETNMYTTANYNHKNVVLQLFWNTSTSPNWPPECSVDCCPFLTWFLCCAAAWLLTGRWRNTTCLVARFPSLTHTKQLAKKYSMLYIQFTRHNFCLQKKNNDQFWTTMNFS